MQFVSKYRIAWLLGQQNWSTKALQMSGAHHNKIGKTAKLTAAGQLSGVYCITSGNQPCDLSILYYMTSCFNWNDFNTSRSSSNFTDFDAIHYYYVGLTKHGIAWFKSYLSDRLLSLCFSKRSVMSITSSATRLSTRALCFSPCVNVRTRVCKLVVVWQQV